MEANTTFIETLFEKIVTYIKTSLELLKLEIIYKSVNIISSIAIRLIVIFFITLFLFFLSIGMAFFLGEWLGKIYYGFFAMAFVYIILTILFLVFQKQLIKNPICNFLIRKTISKDEDK